jgi:hypothetical protein
MPNYNVWTKHGERGVIMEDNEEEGDDDNYPGFPEYGDAFMGEAKGKLKKRHMMSPLMNLVGPLLMHGETAKLQRRRRSLIAC